MTVAVLDTGIDATHEAFRGKRIVQKDFTGEGDGDQNGHGTHCAGTVFGGEVDDTRIGVAPGVKKALIGKVLAAAGRLDRSDRHGHPVGRATERPSSPCRSAWISRGWWRLSNPVARGEPATSRRRSPSAYRANVRLFDRLASLSVRRGRCAAKTLLVAAAGNESRRGATDFDVTVAPPAVAEGMVSVGALAAGAPGGSPWRRSRTSAPSSRPGRPYVRQGRRRPAHDERNEHGHPPRRRRRRAWLEKLGGADALFSVDELRGRLIGGAIPDQVDSPTRGVDCGAGLVQAPAR